jgi:RNA-binding protein 5/10
MLRLSIIISLTLLYKSAAAVLGATMSPQIHPSGFRISDRPVASSFAHPYSFQAAADLMIRDDACLPSSVALGGSEGTWVRYWDEGSTVAVLEFEVEEPSAPQQPVKDKKEKRKVKGKDRCSVAAKHLFILV